MGTMNYLMRARQFDLEVSGKTAFDFLDSRRFRDGDPNSIIRHLCRTCIHDLAVNFPKRAEKISVEN